MAIARKTNPFHALARSKLDRHWREISALPLEGLPHMAGISDAIQRILSGKEIGWRYSIYIQLLGKATNFELNALCLQDKYSGEGAWDAREFAKAVVVPWNAQVGAPLGQSGDPYVSNTFRHPSYGEEMARDRKSPELYELALGVVTRAQSATSSAQVDALLRVALAELRRYLQDKNLDFPAPKHVSLRDCAACVREFLDAKSGGARLQGVVYALFETLANVTQSYSKVDSRHVNASDTASGSVADIECWKDGKLLLAVEVKDRPLTVPELEQTVHKARTGNITELLFVVRGNTTIPKEQVQTTDTLIEKEFSAGLNLYVEDAESFVSRFLLFLGEEGRRAFLLEVARALTHQKADFQHRLAWSQAVRNL